MSVIAVMIMQFMERIFQMVSFMCCICRVTIGIMPKVGFSLVLRLASGLQK